MTFPVMEEEQEEQEEQHQPTLTRPETESGLDWPGLVGSGAGDGRRSCYPGLEPQSATQSTNCYQSHLTSGHHTHTPSPDQ